MFDEMEYKYLFEMNEHLKVSMNKDAAPILKKLKHSLVIVTSIDPTHVYILLWSAVFPSP